MDEDNDLFGDYQYDNAPNPPVTVTAVHEEFPSPPPPDPPAGDEYYRDPTPPVDPPTAHQGHHTPPPDPPAQGHRRTIGDVDLDELERLAKAGGHADVLQSISFIQALRCSTLDDALSPLDPDALDRLRNPPQHQLHIEDPHMRLAIDMYLALEHSTVDAYNNVRKGIMRCYPDVDIPSYHAVKSIVAQMSGIESIVDHMCIDGCTAFTGEYSHLDRCPHCHSYRYDQIKYNATNGRVKSPVKVFHTIPIGPQLQTLYRDPQGAVNMCYRTERTRVIFEELDLHDGKLAVYDDIITGTEYLSAVHDGKIRDDDIVLMLSIDGAQLYESKESDCWIYIWIIINLSPDLRYKKKYILPGGIILGPKKPKFIESFLFPGLHHVVGLQKEGLKIWDASKDRAFSSDLFFAFGTADGPGLLSLSSMVGHTGKNGCRMYCGLRGHHKPGQPQYYPVLLKPLNYAVSGCDHDDIDVTKLSLSPCSDYVDNLYQLVSAVTTAQYNQQRLETGIVKPSILLGLLPNHMFGIPECFTPNIMHFEGPNMGSLFTDLWRGTMRCDATDNKDLWDWAVFRDKDIWAEHGAAVAACAQYLPGSFDRPPRNPAEKINTFYKAWEFILWLWGLGPALLYGILPDKYWQNFCKFVRGVRIMSQHSLTFEDIQEAHDCFCTWENEFEQLYYQRRGDRIHFVRPCVHQSNHLAAESFRSGPSVCYAQWTMERVIGMLGMEIRQPSNPFSNLTFLAIRRCQINALKVMIPDLEPPDVLPPTYSVNLGDGYVLLRARDRYAYNPSEAESHLIREFLNAPVPKFKRWARLRLPNGQIARCAWKETLRSADKVRMARNVKVTVPTHVVHWRLIVKSGLHQ
jgi:hypothetical protein